MPDAPTAWHDPVLRSAPIGALAEVLSRGGTAAVSGARGSLVPLLAGAVARDAGRTVLLVVAHLDEADDALDDLESAFAGEQKPGDDASGGDGGSLASTLKIERFGALEALPGDKSAGGLNLDTVAERLAVVRSAVDGDYEPATEGGRPAVVVAPIQALMQPVPDPAALDRLTLQLTVGSDLSPGRLLDWLDRAGYSRQDAIDQPGDFATRGGIVDVFPMGGSLTDADGRAVPLGPFRLDFFGDEIERIDRVDPDTMGSLGRLGGAGLVGGSDEDLRPGADAAHLLDLLPPSVVPMLAEPMELQEQARGYFERLTQAVGIAPPRDVFRQLLNRPHAELNLYSSTSNAEATPIDLPVAPLPTFDQDARSAILELGELARDDDAVVKVLCMKPAERQRLRELLAEHVPDAAERVGVELGGLHRGFVWEPGGLHVVPHHELFHRYETRRRVRRVMSVGAAGSGAAGSGGTPGGVGDAFLDLEVGDYVVHVDHGIAKFTGLKNITRGEKAGEYLTLQFADQALLHVPVAQIDRVQKYVGGFQGRPPLSTLGGKRWKKQKDSVAEAVKDMAAELLRVQAARSTQPGVRYPADTAWQKEFEAEFPYDETDDQLAAIAAIKKDMAEPTPMDRLICGDVGFGKTEVAIRGAFKAVEFGKQVAVLVPTTVLAEQHERTFRGRMADYPFRIASLSRFKTAAEQRNTLQQLQRGEVDVLIGTHRILSRDVKFADLGLVIIDEEQRFGVEHKNKLLQLRLTAEVLTLTATPIPRTLHMSMVGLRDISSLTTAPVDRRAIVTEVVPYDNQRIKHALVRELSREGQAYFVHNRVHNIQTVADDLQKLVPDARILIGHGQMPPRKLEEVMLAFMRREADILVSTTIIESGIDIPTANTMFITRPTTSAWPSCTSCGGVSAGTSTGRTATCCCRRTGR